VALVHQPKARGLMLFIFYCVSRRFQLSVNALLLPVMSSLTAMYNLLSSL